MLEVLNGDIGHGTRSIFLLFSSGATDSVAGAPQVLVQGLYRPPSPRCCTIGTGISGAS